MKRAELCFSICLLVVGMVFFIRSFQYNAFSNICGVGPAFFPRAVSIIFICLTAANIWSLLRNKSFSNSKGIFKKENVFQQVFFIIAIIVTLFLINILGMLLSLFLFLVVGLHYFEKVSWLKSAVVGVVLTIGIYLIFVKWCNLSLPSGIFL